MCAITTDQSHFDFNLVGLASASRATYIRFVRSSCRKSGREPEELGGARSRVLGWGPLSLGGVVFSPLFNQRPLSTLAALDPVGWQLLASPGGSTTVQCDHQPNFGPSLVTGCCEEGRSSVDHVRPVQDCVPQVPWDWSCMVYRGMNVTRLQRFVLAGRWMAGRRDGDMERSGRPLAAWLQGSSFEQTIPSSSVK